jgi:hypothetical protein
MRMAGRAFRLGGHSLAHHGVMARHYCGLGSVSVQMVLGACSARRASVGGAYGTGRIDGCTVVRRRGDACPRSGGGPAEGIATLAPPHDPSRVAEADGANPVRTNNGPANHRGGEAGPRSGSSAGDVTHSDRASPPR